MADITDDDIVTAALSPSSASADGESVSARPISDLIKAKAVAALAGGKSGWGCVRAARIVPPGTIGPNNTESE
jgi:hypothetical protein